MPVSGSNVACSHVCATRSASVREGGPQPPVADPLRVRQERRAVDVGAREALGDPGEAAVLQPDDEQREARGARQRTDERDDEREGEGGGEGVQDASA